MPPVFLMRSHLRAVVVLVLAAGLLALFLRGVDVSSVAAEISRARPGWLALSLSTMVLNLGFRSLRWRFLLEPLGKTSFLNAFRATAVGFAANTVLPARAGEVIRPYFLAREQSISATGAFATIVLERVLDTLTVLLLLASAVFLFDRGRGDANPAVWRVVQATALGASAVAVFALALMIVLAGNPARFARLARRVERVLPAKLAGFVERAAERFASGLGVLRRPRRVLLALVWSFPLWLSIAAGIWAAAVAFRLPVPFAGSFLLMALLVIGVAVPTPGYVGGFHEAFRAGSTIFFGAPEQAAVGAAIVLHLLSLLPSLLLGLLFAAQAGLNLSGMRRLAIEPQPGATS